ncbi:FtsB family cell division protein [Agromyces atrinae]|uniref:Cell division protein FtsB n=1 Tax=Agromyces atrinae TaxID=592376 RepID=A0A4Q2M1U7_9MICO|nr:septum formation initiator family protein [Agromyces atrinae]NYD68812.1 cell division protein FtsB [Agromyces atrinae]RXZ85107.1 septum formation initiator family protein [Agromyces atrinae]RXZ85812.1 septum formation initiator family protein [Agromyces atrinae]
MARRPSRSAPDVRRESESVQTGWLSGIRFSGFTIIMFGIIVLAVVVLAPSLKVYAEQRAQIVALAADVAAKNAQVDDLTAERERWNDTTYIQTQARERLYFVKPGEVSYLVVNDLPPESADGEAAPISDTVEETRPDWMRTLLASVVTAGLAPAPGDAEQPADTAPADTAPADTAPAEGDTP